MFHNNLSIIILTYDDLIHTKKCLEYLYKNTLISFELVIVDNGSYPETIEYIEEFKKTKDNIVFYRSDKNLGCVAGRNFGYFLADYDSDYICFLDNDIYVRENWLDAYAKCFKKGNDICGTEAWRMRDADFFPTNKLFFEKDRFHYIGAGSMIVKNSVIKDIGLFDPIYNPLYWEDPDFNFRAADAGYKRGRVIEPVIEHQPHSLLGRNQNRSYFFHRSHMNFKKKWEGRKPNEFEVF